MGLEGIRVERWVEVICRRYSYVIIRCEDFAIKVMESHYLILNIDLHDLNCI